MMLYGLSLRIHQVLAVKRKQKSAPSSVRSSPRAAAFGDRAELLVAGVTSAREHLTPGEQAYPLPFHSLSPFNV